jgi:tetratricopeptide (TPR) repeat protein
MGGPPNGAGLSVSLALLALASTGTDRLRNVAPGEPLPPFQDKTLGGSSLASKDLAGRAVVLVYLSAGQEQSEKALAAAHRVVTRLERDELALICMSADTSQTDELRALRQRLAIDEPLLLDEQRQYYGQLGLIAFPTTIVTSRDGKLLHVLASWTRSYEHHLDLYCRHALGELDEAALAGRLAVRPTSRDAGRAKADRHRSMAAILRSKGMGAAAVRELEQAVELDPDHAEAALELAELLVAEGQLEQAERRVVDLLQRRPNHPNAKLVQGLIGLRRGELERAEQLLTEALRLNPDPVRAHYYLGQLYERRGACQAALEHYRAALESALGEP